MVLEHFPEFKDDAHFASEMLREQDVFIFPGMVRVEYNGIEYAGILNCVPFLKV